MQTDATDVQPRALLAVETGGTKIIARIVDTGGATLDEGRWATTTPDDAADAILALVGDRAVAAAAIASFGPLIVDPASADYGRMLDTPKLRWAGSNLRAMLAGRLGCPVAVDTDVNAAALAEAAIGAGQGVGSVAYLTVGTGIGAGLARGGRSLVGALHPEVGHLRLVRRADDAAPSGCPFHADCAEGLAAGPALALRLGEGGRLADAPAQAALVADYLGQVLATLVYAWSPGRIVLGGGVMTTPGLLEATAAAMRAQFAGYGVGPAALEAGFVVPAALADAGLEGALHMARELTV